MEGVNANELRMGNWVMVGRTPTQIEGIDEQGINSSTSGGYYPGDVEVDYEAYFKGQSFWSNYHEPMPIPLTPEILLACGFIVETNFYERYEHPNLKCRWVTQTLIGEPIEKSFLRFDSIRKPPHTCTDIYFLHQLQNIHFALTQKEITYNPQTTNK